MFRINPGELNKLVDIEERIDVRGSMSQTTESWTTFTRAWCKVLTIRGDEAERAKRETGRTQKKFYCRYFSGLENGMRLNMGNQIYDIVEIDNIEEKNRWYGITGIETK